MSERINMRNLEKDIDRLRDQVLSVPLSQIKIGEVFNEIFDLAFSYNIMIPGEFTMLCQDEQIHVAQCKFFYQRASHTRKPMLDMFPSTSVDMFPITIGVEKHSIPIKKRRKKAT